jgi:hypothetical protein
MPVAERRQETGTSWLALRGRPGQLAGYGHMPGPERVLTWSGEPQGRRREASEPEDTLDAASAVNRPRAVPAGRMTIDLA